MSEDEDKVVSLKRGKEKKQKQNDELHEHCENNHNELVYCSFCHRPNTMVLKMIQGPGVNICSECTMIALQYFILEDRIPSKEAQKILDALWGARNK